MLIVLYFEKEVVIMFIKEICGNVKFNLVISNRIFMPKTLYNSPTLMEIIFSK